METKKEMAGKNEMNLIEEWEKPSVKELDINSITQSGTTGTGGYGAFIADVPWRLSTVRASGITPEHFIGNDDPV